MKPTTSPTRQRPIKLREGHAHLNGEPDAWATIGVRGSVRVCKTGSCPVHVTPRRICSTCRNPTAAL